MARHIHSYISMQMQLSKTQINLGLHTQQAHHLWYAFITKTATSPVVSLCVKIGTSSTFFAPAPP